MDKKACVCILLAGACWASNGLFFRQFSAMGLGSLEVLFLKMLVAAVVLGGYLLMKNPRAFRLHKRDLGFFLAIGFIGMLCFNYFYFQAMVHNTLAVAVALLYTSPVFVVFLSALLFKESLTCRKLTALAVIFGGCLCASGIFGEQLSFSAIGLFFGIGAGLFYGSYSIFSRYVINRGYSSMTIAFYAIAISCLGSIFLADFDLIRSCIGMPLVMNAVGIAMFACLVPMLLFTYGLQKVETGISSMLVTSELLVATLFSVLILGEAVHPITIAGILLILAGIVLMNRKEGKR